MFITGNLNQLIKILAKDIDDMYIFFKPTFFVLMGTNVFHLQ